MHTNDDRLNPLHFVLSLFLLGIICPPSTTAFTLVENGVAKSVVIAADDKDKNFQAGINDLLEFIAKMSDAKLSVLKPGDEIPDGLNIIRVGKALAGPVSNALDEVASSEGGFIITEKEGVLYLAGQSPLATSFACTDLLERLGCRWYLPGPLGEVYPKKATLIIDSPNIAEKPDMNPRWLRLDADWSRRNKLGGSGVPAAHSFHGFLRAEEFEAHPEWFPLRNGQRVAGGQLCLSNPQLIDRIVERITQSFDKNPSAVGASLGPNDGRGWCECGPCEAMDSGRIDPFAQDRDVIDRLIKMMNQVDERVSKKHPGKKYGFYVYSNYQLPPVTVTPSKSIVPVFAPITYCRLHSMFNPLCPTRNAVRKMYEGWSKYGLEMHYRGYTFNLAGLQTPFHSLYKWVDDIPWMYEHNILGFFPESIQSWSASAPGYNLAARMAWKVKSEPRAVVSEFCNGLFGDAGKSMDEYFWMMADAIRDADHHTGNDTNYPDIYTEKVMKSGAKLLKKAESSSDSEREKSCVRIFKLAHDYLQAFLDMQEFQRAFKFEDSKAAYDELVKLQDELIKWDARWLSSKAAKSYLKRFWGPAVVQSHEKTTGGNELVTGFPDEWDFLLDQHDAGEWLELYSPTLKGGNWQRMKTYSASWMDQGFGAVNGIGWYRTRVSVPQKFKGRKIMMWFGAVDEAAKIWINGKPITWVAEVKDRKTQKVIRTEVRDQISGSWRPHEIEVTDAIEFGKENLFVVKVTNQQLNEVGTGGIQKIVLLYAPKNVEAKASEVQTEEKKGFLE